MRLKSTKYCYTEGQAWLSASSCHAAQGGAPVFLWWGPFPSTGLRFTKADLSAGIKVRAWKTCGVEDLQLLQRNVKKKSENVVARV